jgi:hypothetical protein
MLDQLTFHWPTGHVDVLAQAMNVYGELHDYDLSFLAQHIDDFLTRFASTAARKPCVPGASREAVYAPSPSIPHKAADNGLDPVAVAAVVLRHRDCLTLVEISTLLGVSTAEVRARVAACVRQLSFATSSTRSG